MKLVPVFTEKSMVAAKSGKYSFWVDPLATKDQIKVAVREAFGVHSIGVVTMNFRLVRRRTMYGKFVTQKARKKAIVTLKKGEKLEIFEVKEEKKK